MPTAIETLDFYGADSSAPEGSMGHALARVRDQFEELLASDLELDEADESLRKSENCHASERVRRFNRASVARTRRAAAIACCRGGA